MERLQQRQYNAIVHSIEYKTILNEVSRRIIDRSRTAPNEATIESCFDCEFFSLFRNLFGHLGFEYNPTKEVAISTKRHITKGRADTLVGALIIEFKQPSTLSNSDLQNSAISQVIEYLEGLEHESELVGFVTDGAKGCFVIRSEDGYTHEPFVALNGNQLDRLVQFIIQSKLTALTATNLVNDFCNPPENDGIAFRLVNNLYRALTNSITPKTKMLFDEWKELFNLSHDDVSQQQAIIDRRRSLEKLLGVSFSGNDEEYTALFALQTAYVIIIKIVAYRIVSIVRYNSSFIDFETLAETDEIALRQQLVSLEDGAIFRSYGITNLLEGDFFSWYSSPEQWDANIADSISDVFDILSRYADKAVLNSDQKTADFFKELYQHMMPSAVRHALGEYYTKQWVAKKVFEEAATMINSENWRGLDPCCGSGTFVTVMIESVLKSNAQKSNKERLNEVLSRISGIDLNPVAVLTARVNYFINIAPLLTNQDEIEIPIYLGDSSYVPKTRIYDGVECLEYTINTIIQPISIIIPRSMVQDTVRFSRMMTSIELNIRALDEAAAYTKLESLVAPDDLTEKIKEQIHLLTGTLVNLESRNWNGIWARIITNYLTTANLGKYDVIIGNPPWVDWKSLPSGYRDKIKGLCISRQLFSGDGVTGGINLNICALISNVVAENWLSEDGVLGFLMPEPLLFQQSYEGFRNLLLSDGSRLYFKKITNWTKAGHPFKPVTQRFLTYYMAKAYSDYKSGIDVDWMVLKEHKNYENNTKWGAAVISDIETEWGGLKHPLFQNHCVSICEDVEGNFISEDEAHFICGILNAPISYKYVISSSDSRSYPIRPRIYIPKYDYTNDLHRQVVELSKAAHQHYEDQIKISRYTNKLDEVYLKIAKQVAH